MVLHTAFPKVFARFFCSQLKSVRVFVVILIAHLQMEDLALEIHLGYPGPEIDRNVTY